ncbi:uncharacterized protein FPRO_05532 [Fusarium proliferatum ET1]|uniref:Zn(2)-C6 fungal-type domain-containing protein n=1 Tax=Fusarium proliferatum (strain ET1) TaxID=1227346 RepID=A0A1L7VHN3_FUSPR|nr:uncharacterized protein FPRO_05532 [Fusarium proliferatum ET1]CZR39276.1 uncharacterized protein FPRO_05532 [Fusarium proliferatum ET1]
MKRQVPQEPSEDSQPSRKRGLSSRRPRASQACLSCAASKVRCDDLEICRRCLKRGVSCIRSSQVREDCRMASAEAPRALSETSTRTSIDGGDSTTLSLTTNDSAEVPPLTMASTMPAARDEGGEGLLIDDETPDFDFAFPSSHMSLDCSRPLQVCSDIQATDIIDTTLSDTAGWPKNASLHAEFDPSFLLPLPYIDFSGFIDGSSLHNFTDSIATSSKGLPTEDKLGFEEAVIAYNTTLGSWKPSNEDYIATARAALYIPLDEQLHLGEGLGHLNPSVIKGSLSSARRDEIIVAMIDWGQTAHSLQAIRMFPSTEILDKFLKVFLTTQETNASAFIHIATFDPSTCSLYLVIACIIAGAASSSRPSARKFALGLFDVLRLHLAASGERENTLTRDLSISEISDFLSELTILMLRHAGMLAQHTYFHPSLMLDRPSSELDKSWGKWAQQESFKRTVFRHLLQCTQRSVIRNVQAQLCPLEVSTPLPEDCRFWFAKSAAEWESLYKQYPRPVEPRITINDCLSDIRSIDLPSSLSKLWVLYSLLSLLIKDHRRISILHKKQDPGWSFTDVTRSPLDSHLVFIFSELRHIIEGDPAKPPILTFMVEFNILYSAIPRHLRDSLLTNGKKTSASDDLSQLQEWQGRSSRSAIWHAGQLIRACRMITPEERRDFHLIGVCHSLLCLWTYWTATKKRPSGITGTKAISLPRVQLDGPESLESQRWISHNKGTPYLAEPCETDGICGAELVPVDATHSEENQSRLPLVGILSECFSNKVIGRYIPIFQHASLVLHNLEKL